MPTGILSIRRSRDIERYLSIVLNQPTNQPNKACVISGVQLSHGRFSGTSPAVLAESYSVPLQREAFDVRQRFLGRWTSRESLLDPGPPDRLARKVHEISWFEGSSGNRASVCFAHFAHHRIATTCRFCLLISIAVTSCEWWISSLFEKITLKLNLTNQCIWPFWLLLRHHHFKYSDRNEHTKSATRREFIRDGERDQIAGLDQSSARRMWFEHDFSENSNSIGTFEYRVSGAPRRRFFQEYTLPPRISN